MLELDSIKKSDKIMRLLQSLSLQIGSQVSYNEIGQMVGLDSKTVEKYIDILEKCFVIFRLPSYARNMRNELKASRNVFFYDMGIRNAVIGNYTPIELRNPSEIGEMWENFVIAERLKRNVMSGSNAKMYFWRTQQQSEIDLIEDNMGRLDAFEFKWNPKPRHEIQSHSSMPMKARPSMLFRPPTSRYLSGDVVAAIPPSLTI